MWLALGVLGCGGDKTTPTHTGTPTSTAETGGPGVQWITDKFDQDLVSAVDIVWLMDAGWTDAVNSMDDVMDRVSDTLLLADPNWQMGVLDSTDTGDRFGLLTTTWATYPAPRTAFSLGVPGTDSRVSEALYTAFQVRKDSDANKGFLRSDAELYVLVMTDREDDSSSDQVSQGDFQDWFANLQPSEAKHLGVVTVSDEEAYWSARTYDASIRTGTSNLPKTVDQMILEAIHQKVTFELTEVPSVLPLTVDVVYRNHATTFYVDKDWSYDESTNSITFDDYRPPDGSQVVIRYPTGGIPADSGAHTGTSSN